MAFSSQNFAFSALHLAAKDNDCEKMKTLLKEVDIDAKGFENNTALHVGSMYGHLEVVKLLLENKANVNAKKDGGLTPLHLALQKDDLEVSEFLMESGANVNAKDDRDWIPLHIAAHNGFSLKLVEDLIAKGSDINARVKGGETALHLAAKKNNLDIINLLIKRGADANSVDTGGWTPLHFAAYDCNLEVAKSLVDQMVDINAKTVRGFTSLHFAVNHNNFDVIQLLLERGADVNALTHGNVTPLHIAATHGYDYITTVLLKFGADVSVIGNKIGATALHCAARNGHSEVVKTLIMNGADVNAKMYNDATPLHLSAECDNLDTAKCLLMNGAYFDARAKTEDGKYVLPLYTAKKVNCSSTVIKFLKLVGQLFEAVQENDYLEVENCIKGGVIIDSKDTDGRTPLHFAVNNGDTDIVSILLANEADVTKVTYKGNTPLHTAVSIGYKAIVEILLQHVSHDKLRDFINARTMTGSTSLHVAAKKGFFDIGKILLLYGAIYNIKNNNGETPFDISQNQNLTNLLKLVEELYEDAKTEKSEITDMILDRIHLLNKLSKLQVYVESDLSNQDTKRKVILYPDSIYSIVEYLPNYDLINFILAIYDSQKY